MPSQHKVINRNIVWDQPGALYGFCPRCGAPGEMRESIDGSGKDRCQNKHTYPSAEAQAKLATGPEPAKKKQRVPRHKAA